MAKSLLESTNNTREVVKGLWRSDALLKLPRRDVEILKKNNIRHIIDLRGHKVAAMYPCSVCSDRFFDYHNIPIEFTDEGSYKKEIDWFYIYHGILHHSNFERVLRTIVDFDDNDGVLVNCTAGKDRTGTVFMVIEYILGYSREQIIADYLASIDYLGEWFCEWERQHGLPAEKNMPMREFAELILNDSLLDEIKDSDVGRRIVWKFGEK